MDIYEKINNTIELLPGEKKQLCTLIGRSRIGYHYLLEKLDCDLGTYLITKPTFIDYGLTKYNVFITKDNTYIPLKKEYLEQEYKKTKLEMYPTIYRMMSNKSFNKEDLYLLDELDKLGSYSWSYSYSSCILM